MPTHFTCCQPLWQGLFLALSVSITTIAAAQDAPGVQLAEVTESPVFEETRLNGTVNAMRLSRLSTSVAGLVEAVNADVGEWVTPGDELMTLVDLENLRLDFQVAQGYFPRLDDNSELLLVSGAAGDEPVPLDIASRVPVTDPASRTFLLRATAPDEVPLMPGMAVEAMLRVSTGTKGLTVPRDALNRYPEGRVTVWTAEPAKEDDRYTVSEKRVRTGSGFRDRVEILDGLEAGQQVVSRGNESLDEGMTVRISRREAR